MASSGEDEIKSKTLEIYSLIDNGNWAKALSVSSQLFRRNQFDCRVSTAHLKILSNIALWIQPDSEMCNVLQTVMLTTMEEIGKDEGIIDIHPLTSTYFPFNRSQLKLIATKYYETHYKTTGRQLFSSGILSQNKSNRKIKVGILSSRLRDCIFAHSFLNWLKSNKKINSKLSITCISTTDNGKYSSLIDTTIRSEIQHQCHEFVNLGPMHVSPDKLASKLRDLRLYVLIDTNDQYNGMEMRAIAQKPVPVIVNFQFGSPGTSGSPSHDYILLDQMIAPIPYSINDYTEKILQFPETCILGGHLNSFPHLKYSRILYTTDGKSIYINGALPIPQLHQEQINEMYTYYRYKEERFDTYNLSFWNGQTTHSSENVMKFCSREHNYVFTTRSEYKLPDKKIVFAFLESLCCLNPETLDCWIKVLEKVPNSVLWLCEYPKKGFENIYKFVQATHSEEMAKRLISVPFSSNRELQLRRCALANLFLDSTPRGGQWSTLDAITINVPVLTIYGDTPCGRVTASMLHSLGLDELIAKSPAEFVKLATNLGNDPRRLTEFSNKIMSMKSTCVLWNGEKFAVEFAIAIEKIWTHHNNGQLPTHFFAPSHFSSDRIKSFDVQLDNKIGHGSNGIVYKGTFRGRQVAVKKISPVDIESKYIFSELEIHKQLDHPAILKLLAAFADKDAYLVTELCGTNIEMIIKKSKLSETNASRFAIQLILGVEYLHSLNIIHRDIKASNCLIDMKGNLKICDFDNAIKCICFGTYNSTTLSILQELQAPEVILNREYSFASDVFASGATIVYFYTGTKLNMLTNGRKLMKSMQHLTTIEKVAGMLHDIPERRPTCKELTNYVKFYALAKSDRISIFNDNQHKPLVSNESKKLSEPVLIDMVPRKLQEHCNVMQYYQYDDIKNRMREGVNQLKIGDTIVVNIGHLYGEEGVIIEIVGKMANIKFKVSNRMKPDRLEKNVPLWMIQKE